MGNVTATVMNDLDEVTNVATYNGSDMIFWKPHKAYTIQPGSTVEVQALADHRGMKVGYDNAWAWVKKGETIKLSWIADNGTWMIDEDPCSGCDHAHHTHDHKTSHPCSHDDGTCSDANASVSGCRSDTGDHAHHAHGHSTSLSSSHIVGGDVHTPASGSKSEASSCTSTCDHHHTSNSHSSEHPASDEAEHNQIGTGTNTNFHVRPHTHECNHDARPGLHEHVDDCLRQAPGEPNGKDTVETQVMPACRSPDEEKGELEASGRDNELLDVPTWARGHPTPLE